MKGHEYGVASGPILISSGEGGDKASLAGVLRRGKVLGGARSFKNRDLSLFVRNEFRSIRNSKRIADRIGARFHHYNRHGQREPLAVPKTDQLITLKVHPGYRDNYARYLQVVRNIAFRETPVARRLRLQRLQEELLDPQTSEMAAVRLEAIGEDAVPFLKRGLKSPLLEVRFNAAVALAYLDDASGVHVLAEAARGEPAFRVFAFAALSAVDDAESHLALRDLVHERSAETRYGAFRALSVLDAHDAVIRGENLNDQFQLHVIESPTEPMIHLTKRRRPEVVIFHAQQQFETPLVVRAGRRIQVTALANSDTITVSRFEVGKDDRREEVPTNVADVIRKVVDLGASYPDVVQMLVQAERQHNLAGHIAIDALPRAGRFYERPQPELAGRPTQRARIGNSSRTPNLFDAGDDAPRDNTRADVSFDASSRQRASGDSGKATAVKLADKQTEHSTEPKSDRFGLVRRLLRAN